MTARECYSVAVRAIEAGISVVPPLEDGTKRPDGSWKRWQQERPDRDQLRTWYKHDGHTGIGYVCGTVSGGLEMLEAESLEVYERFRVLVTDNGLGDVLEQVERGYMERTPGGGVHLLYRSPSVLGNTKLARVPDGTDEQGRPKVRVLMETRGEGGFTVAAPSNGRVHPTGKSYVLESGDVTSIATITTQDRDALWAVARMLDEMPIDVVPDPVSMSPKGASGKRPGEDFNERGDVLPILTRHGWTVVHRVGEVVHLRRPGKNEGTSATLNWKGSRLFYPFTSSTLFDPEKGYSPWRVYALLEHEGDFASAAKALGAEGFGEAPKSAGPTPVLGGASLPPGSEGLGGEAPSSKGFHLTDLGNAERLVAGHGHDLRHCHVQNRWYVWDGTRFRSDEHGGVELRAKRTVRMIYSEATEAEEADVRKALVKHATKSEAAERIAAMVKLARSEPGIPVSVDDLDPDSWLLNVENGTLDLRTGELREHSRTDLITKRAAVRFDPAAQCPRFLEFLNWAMVDDQALVSFLQRAIGYSLTGRTTERMLLILYGEGKNGKSTLLEVIRALLGDYALRTPTETLLAKRDSGIPNDVARLRGVRFVTASEAEEGQRLAEAKIKDMTGGDTISARFLYGELFDFMPRFKIWLSTNHKPGVRGTDRAIWDRIKLVPFHNRVEPDAMDHGLKEKLISERSGILNWALSGCLDWRREGLGEPAAVVAATEEYRAEMDMLGAFIDDRCITGPSETCTAHHIYSVYQKWCEENGERPITQTMMGRKLTDRGFDSVRIGKERVRSWVGIGLRDMGDRND